MPCSACGSIPWARFQKGRAPNREPMPYRRDGAQSWSLNAAILSNAGWLVCTCGRDPGDTEKSSAATEIAMRIGSVSRKGCDIKCLAAVAPKFLCCIQFFTAVLFVFISQVAMSFIVWAIILVALVGVLGLRASGSGLLPGPPGLPLIGNWSELRGKKPYLVLTEWARRYGDFYSYRVGRNSLFVVSGVDAFDELFAKKGSLYNSRPLTSAMAHRVTGDSRGVTLPYGEPWRVGELASPGAGTEVDLTRLLGPEKSPADNFEQPELQDIPAVSGIREQGRFGQSRRSARDILPRGGKILEQCYLQHAVSGGHLSRLVSRRMLIRRLK